MAIQVFREPELWSSVYRPIEYEFLSDRYPNSTAGETLVPILIIQESAGNTQLVAANDFTTVPLEAGETILIEGTSGGLYDGRYKVRTAFDAGGLLNAILDTPYVGDDFGGTISRVYDGFRLIAEVTFGNLKVVSFPMDPDEFGRFSFNMDDAGARQFISIFEEVTPGDEDIEVVYPCDKSIAMPYGVNVYEQYTVWSGGVPATLDRTFAESIKINKHRIVNCIHPYHKVAHDGTIQMDHEDTLDSFIVVPDDGGQLEMKKFLTWAHREDQLVREGDDFYLSFLNDFEGDDFRIHVRTYTTSGVQNNYFTGFLTSGNFATTINVGPKQLEEAGVFDASTTRYEVWVSDILNSRLTEAIELQVDRECKEIHRRIHWQNQLGGFDNFNMKGREIEAVSTTRETIKRRHLPLPVNGTPYIGGWNERTYRTDPQRNHVVTSDLVHVETMRWLIEDCFESHDIATMVRDGWWTRIVVDSVDSAPVSTSNRNERFTLEYHYGVDNSSQRG